jgi:hypothetical protein
VTVLPMSIVPPPSSTPPGFHPEPLQAVACPACFGAVAVSQELLGQAAECPLCGSGFRVPVPGWNASPPQAPAAFASGSSPPEARPRRRSRGTAPRESPNLEPPTEWSSSAGYTPPHFPEPEPQPEPESEAGTDEPQTATTPAREMEFHEPVRTIGSGDRVVTLHRLTAEEKTARRARRNVIMLLGGVSILMAIVLLLGTKRTKHRGR